MKRYEKIAQLLAAIENCKKSNNTEWEGRHGEDLRKIMKNTAPSGSGIDNGTKIDDRSTPERLIFTCGYHHMNDGGMYDGWTEHELIVTPSLAFGVNIRITGRDRNEIKDYLHDVYHMWLFEICD